MKNICLLLLIFVAYNTNAQLSLSSSQMMPVGTTMHLRSIANLDIIDTTIQGANKTWDFSGIMDDDTTYDDNYIIVDPSKTPDASTFTDANYGYHESNPDGYAYFNLSTSNMQRVGSDYSGNGIVTYSDRQIEYVYPLTLGASSYDTWDNSASSGGGDYDLKCVGSGTLKLPGGKSFNALMVRVHLTEDGGLLDFYTFFWYSADNGATLLEDVFGDGLFISSIGYYARSIDVASGVQSEIPVSQIRYNNPVSNTLNVSLKTTENTGDIHYSLTDVLGKELNAGTTPSTTADYFMNINMNNRAQGIYFLNLTTEAGQKVGSTIKVVKL